MADAGAPAGRTAGDEEESQTFDADLALARSQLQEATLLLQGVEERISQLEERGGASPAEASGAGRVPPPPISTPAPSAAQQGPPQAVSASSPTPQAVVGAAPAPAPPNVEASDAPPHAPTTGATTWAGGTRPNVIWPRGVDIDWEQVLGRNWFAIIGAVALVFGIGFFLKLAFDNNWIGDTGRVVLGVGVGLGLMGVGEYTSRRIPHWSQPVTAGGAAILYLAIYASYGLYELVRPDVAFLFLAVVVALAGLLALRYESIVIAVLGIVGAFLAPLLLGPSLPDERLVLLYILVVDIGILAVATFRNWQWFTLLGWAGSYGLFGYWMYEFPGYEALLVQGALTLVFLVFVGATTLFHLLWRRVPGPLDMGLVAANAAGFFGLTFAVLWADYEAWFGLISLGLALFYGLIAFLAIKRSGGASDVALIALPVTLVFLTVAVPLQFSGFWIPVVWAIEGAVLVWAGFFLGWWQMRAFGIGALTLCVGHILFLDVWLELEDFRLVLNERTPAFLAAVVGFYVAGFLHWRNRGPAAPEWQQYIHPALFGIANVLTLTWLSIEVVNYFDHRNSWSNDPLDPQTAANGKYIALTIMFALYAFILSAVGLGARLRLVRWAALGLMGVAALKLLLIDTWLVRLDAESFTVFLNFRFMVFAVVMAGLSGMAYWSWRERVRVPKWEVYGLLVAVNVVAVWGLSQEIIHYFGSREAVQGGDYSSAKHLSLTVLWAVYSVGVIGAGIVLRSSQVRLAGMALLAVPVLKLFIFDVFLLERGYRVASFVTLGVLLLAMGLVYQRYSLAIRGFFFGQKS